MFMKVPVIKGQTNMSSSPYHAFWWPVKRVELENNEGYILKTDKLQQAYWYMYLGYCPSLIIKTKNKVETLLPLFQKQFECSQMGPFLTKLVTAVVNGQKSISHLG